jgi:hypothetical protein
VIELLCVEVGVSVASLEVRRSSHKTAGPCANTVLHVLQRDRRDLKREDYAQVPQLKEVVTRDLGRNLSNHGMNCARTTEGFVTLGFKLGVPVTSKNMGDLSYDITGMGQPQGSTKPASLTIKGRRGPASCLASRGCVDTLAAWPNRNCRPCGASPRRLTVYRWLCLGRDQEFAPDNF